VCDDDELFDSVDDDVDVDDVDVEAAALPPPLLIDGNTIAVTPIDRCFFFFFFFSPTFSFSTPDTTTLFFFFFLNHTSLSHVQPTSDCQQ
jgi:hypothetical protein